MPSRTVEGVVYTIPGVLFEKFEEVRGDDGVGTIKVATLEALNALCTTAEHNKRLLAVYLVLWLGMTPGVIARVVPLDGDDHRYLATLVARITKKSAELSHSYNRVH